MNLTEMRLEVRQMLGDDNPENQLFSDGALNSHINHAVDIFSSFIPEQTWGEVATQAGSDEINLESLDGIMVVRGVEHPLGGSPRLWLKFCHWGSILALLGNMVTDGTTARVYYGRRHVLDEITSTIPAHYASLVAGGAAGFCALEAAAKSTNRINTGGTTVPNAYQAWGDNKLKAYRRALAKIARSKNLKSSRLYRI